MGYIKHKSDESMEDYLETILQLHKKNGNVRSIDIACELGYTKASISVAMKNLREKQLISMTETGYISLTAEGQRLAESILERHTLISKWLMRVGVSEATAIEDACRIEHDISEETFDKIKAYLAEV